LRFAKFANAHFLFARQTRRRSRRGCDVSATAFDIIDDVKLDPLAARSGDKEASDNEGSLHFFVD
jgi:hypothetical protein